MFLGYGLEEIEVLEYILRRGSAGDRKGSSRIRRYVLQGFFNADKTLFDLLENYYRDSFDTALIGFPKDYRSYDQQTSILDAWSSRLKFGGLTLADGAAAIEDEIRG